jgi:hypothetical protein
VQTVQNHATHRSSVSERDILYFIHRQMWAETNHYFPPGQVETNSASHVFSDLLSKKSRTDSLERRVP